MINSVAAFVAAAKNLSNDDIVYMFEHETEEAVRAEIYALADVNSPEPFRNAMNKLGFVNY